jgi:hypothetical protein
METPSTPRSARTFSRAERIEAWGTVQPSEEDAGGVVPLFSPEDVDPEEDPPSDPPEDPVDDPEEDPVSDEAFFL